MPRLTDRKVLFFIAGTSPTVEEAALIARTEGLIGIRTLKASALYGDKLESCDAVAGTPPAEYLAEFDDVTPEPEGTKATILDGDVIAGVTVSGSGTTATFTVENDAVVAIALT